MSIWTSRTLKMQLRELTNMTKDKTSKKLQAERLVQIYSSSFYMSHSLKNKFDAQELSVDLYKVFGLYEARFNESLKEFDGYTSEDVVEKKFKDRHSVISKKLENLIGHLSVPKPIRNTSENDNEPYYLDKDFETQSKSEVIGKWFERYLSIYGRTCYEFKSEDLENVLYKVKEIGRYKIKKEAMEEVADVSALEGSYEFHIKFKNVPTACRYYEEELGQDGTRKAIKEKIKAHAQIMEKGEELKDWSTINARINSWAHKENEKPNRTNPIPKK